jgi:hypothetical protein
MRWVEHVALVGDVHTWLWWENLREGNQLEDLGVDGAIIQCVRKVSVHLQKVLEVMSTSVYTDLNSFNFIRKHFLQICVRKVAVLL